MNANLPISRRLTLMLSGEDSINEEFLDEKAGIQTQGTVEIKPLMGLPHERFLIGEKVPAAPLLLMGQNGEIIKPNPQDVIACLQPIHLHATRDHLVLLHQNLIDITPEESVNLLKAAKEFITEDFKQNIIYAGTHYWFISAGPFTSLETHSVEQSHGRNIDWWLPRDTDEHGIAKLWRKLQNEIQMLWHIHFVNESREERGIPTINSVWISGIGKLDDFRTPTLFNHIKTLFGFHPLLMGLANYLEKPYRDLKVRPPTVQELAGAFVWPDQPEGLWPLISKSLFEGQLDELEVIDFPGGKERHRIYTIGDLQKRKPLFGLLFWQKSLTPSWQELINK